MGKNKLLYVTGTFLFVNFSTLAVLGLWLKFGVPKGVRFGGAPPSLLGLSRHEWVEIHEFWGLCFIAMVLIHLALNWKWVVNLTKQYFGVRWKRNLLVMGASWIPVLFVSYLVARF